MFSRELLRLCGAVVLLFGCRDPQLVRSIRQGNSAVAQKMIAEGADVNAKDSTRKTALYAAIEAGDKEAYRQLLAKGADPNLCDWVGTSAMHLAAEQADVFWLREALKHKGHPNQPNTGNRAFPNSTPIFYAIYKQRSENVLELMDAGADINHVDGNNNTPLYACMEQRLYALMVKMIEAGADPTPPKPAFSIFANGWFMENYEAFFEPEFRLGPEPGPGSTKADYLALKAMLIEKGYLKQNAAKKK